MTGGLNSLFLIRVLLQRFEDKSAFHVSFSVREDSSLVLKMCKKITSEERGDTRMGSKQTRIVWVAMPARIPKSRHLMHFWLQSWRFRHLWICGLPRFSWLLNWCILLLCELWTWSDLLRYLLFTVRFLRKLSYSVLSHKYFFLIMFFWCEKMKKVSLKFSEVLLYAYNTI